MSTHDLRSAWRRLVRRPGLALSAILTLALGVGATTAVTSVVRGVLIDTLPFDDPDELVHLMESTEHTPTLWVAWDNFRDWRDRNRVFETLAAHRYERVAVSDPGGAAPESVIAVVATAELFSLVGVAPLLGRGFAAEEDLPGAPGALVVSHGFWQRRLGGRGQAVGETLTVGGEQFEVVGVMPPGFLYPRRFRRAEMWIPLGRFARDWGRQRESHPGITVSGRLAPGVSLEAARADMDRVAAELAAEHPATNAGHGVALTGLRERMVEDLRPALRLLAAAVGLLTFLAVVNVANLLLADGAGRAGELAVRRALGAGDGRIARQLLTEILLLAVLGGLAAVAVARGVLALLETAVDVESLPAFGEIAIDGRAWGLSLLVAAAGGLAAGLAPVLAARRQGALRTADRQSAGRRHRRVLDALVVTQLALAAALALGALLAGRSFHRLTTANAGFEPRGVLSLATSLPDEEYREAARQIAFFDRARERLGALPGVAATAYSLPILVGWSSSFEVVDRPAPEGEALNAEALQVSPGYFDTLGIRLLAGRAFTAADRAGAPGVVIVDELLASTLWPAGSALGRRLRLATDPPDSSYRRAGREIVGVAAQVKGRGVQRQARMALYRPFAQAPSPYAYFFARTAADPAVLAGSVLHQLRALEPEILIDEVQPVARIVAGRAASERLTALFLGAFAVLSLALAAVGTYGVTAHSVAARRREIGIRMAAGADAPAVLRLVMGRGLALALYGLVTGSALAALASPLLASRLYGVSPLDPAVWLTLPLLLAAVALAAAAIPAHRASRLDPASVLRGE